MSFSGEFKLSGDTASSIEVFKNSFTHKSFSFSFDSDSFETDEHFVYLWGDMLAPIDATKELLLEKFLKDKEKFHESIDGLYLLFIYSKNDDKLNIFNSRYLATGLYYKEHKESFYFAHEMKDVLELLPDKSEPDFSSIKTFISNGFTSTDQTQIAGVKKLLPSFRVSLSKDIKFENHWNNEFNFNKKPFNNLEKKLDEYEAIYREGIQNFLAAEKPKEVGTLLSGGHDTSFVLIEASQVHDKPIHTFTASFPGWAFDESQFAKRNTEKFGGVFHDVPFLPEDLDYMVELIRANGEPVVGSSLPVHLCAKEASKHVDVMLAGDGGDTMWGEYYPVDEVHKYLKNMPLWMKGLSHTISKKLVDITDWERFWELEHVLSLFNTEKPYEDFMRRLCTYRHFTDEFQKELFEPEIFKKIRPSISSLELEFNKENFSERLIEGKLFNGFYMYQSFHTNKSMEYYDLPLYLPTIYKPLMQFVTNLPEEWVNGGSSFQRMTNSKKINRRFHKKALSRYLNQDEIYNRSFDIPWYNILRPRPVVLEKLLKRLLARGWYQKDTLENMFKEFMGQAVKNHELLELKHHGYRIFTLLSLEIWCMEFLDKKPDGSKLKGKVSLEDYL